MDPSDLPKIAPLTGCLRLAGIITALAASWLLVWSLARLYAILS